MKANIPVRPSPPAPPSPPLLPPGAVFLRNWLVALRTTVTREYANHKSPQNRSVQSGNAWRLLQSVLAGASDAQY